MVIIKHDNISDMIGWKIILTLEFICYSIYITDITSEKFGGDNS